MSKGVLNEIDLGNIENPQGQDKLLKKARKLHSAPCEIKIENWTKEEPSGT
jgi:hypothetical protein